MARPSRPPGFDMTYRPTEEVYGPPALARIPALLYLLTAMAVVALVALGEQSASDTWLFQYVVEADAQRYISARVFAGLLLVSAIAAFVQSSMRGVRVRGDGLEYRDIVTFTWPKLKRYKWAQIDALVIEKDGLIVLDLWNGDRELLPPVANTERLATTLEKVAMARAIPITGGRGVDEIPESDEYE